MPSNLSSPKAPASLAGTMSRRICLTLAAAPLLAPLRAQGEVINVSAAELLAMNLKADGVTLDLPSLADTGASVPLSADIVAPAGLKIETIEVFVPENPNTRALKLKLVEPQDHFSFTTRLRLAGSQDVWVVANLSDGSHIGASAPTVITSSACFDAS
jgi:sulfur-oxidizing protein SoxY